MKLLIRKIIWGWSMTMGKLNYKLFFQANFDNAINTLLCWFFFSSFLQWEKWSFRFLLFFWFVKKRGWKIVNAFADWFYCYREKKLSHHPSKPLVAYFSSRKALDIETHDKVERILFNIAGGKRKRRKQSWKNSTREKRKNKYDLFVRSRLDIIFAM